MRTLVIGLGNPILTDDGAGYFVAKEIEKAVRRRQDIDVIELSVGGITLMEHMIGYQQVILIDALWTSPEHAGQVIVFAAGDLTETLNTRSTHDADLPTALCVGRSLGAELPTDEHIQIVAITANQVLDFGDEPTPAVKMAIPEAIQTVLDLLGITEISQMPYP